MGWAFFTAQGVHKESDPATFTTSSAPIGAIIPFGGSVAPPGWLFCDGSIISRTTYAALFAVVGTSYGAGDGSTTFKIPEMMGRVPCGKGANADVNTLGQNEGYADGVREPWFRSVIPTQADHNHTYVIGIGQNSAKLAAIFPGNTNFYRSPWNDTNPNPVSYQEDLGTARYQVVERWKAYTDDAGNHNHGGQTDWAVVPYLVTNFIIKYAETSPASVIAIAAAPLVTSLPGSPVDGQECYYQVDATNGIIWHLRYRAGSASAYKWEFVGGSPITANVDTWEATVATHTNYQDLPTVGPSLTIPLAGDYIFTGGAVPDTNGVVGAQPFAALKIGAATTADTEVVAQAYSNDATRIQAMGNRTLRRTVTAAATVCKLQYRNSSGNAANFERRSLSAYPARVG